MQLRRVVITGMGAITPIGNDLHSYWHSLIHARSGAAPITHFDAAHFKTKFACEVKDFDPLLFMDKKEVRRHDMFTQYALACADEGVRHAGLDSDTIDKKKVGVIWCSGVGGIGSFQEEVIQFTKDNYIPRFSPFFVPKMIADLAAGYISIRYGFRGLNFCVVSACASATNGLIDAFNYIRLGRANAIVCGASEAAVNAVGIGGFNALKALSERNDDPCTASRPFDKDRDGFVMGEGGGCIVLEDYHHALSRGATIFAEMIGGGMSADAYHITAPHPNGEGALDVMNDALHDAQIPYTDVDYINMHGTSTPLGDRAEASAIVTLFGDHTAAMNVSSTKSMTGHLLGAAGAIEAIAAIKSVYHDIVPPTINHFTVDEDFDSRLNFTFNSAQKRSVNIAMSNTFGFGGHNAAVVFKKFEEGGQ